MLALTLTAAASLLAAPAPPDAPPEVKGANPSVALARLGDDGFVYVLCSCVVPVTTEVRVKAVENGKEVERVVPRTSYVTQSMQQRYEAKDVQAFDAKGEKIDPKTLSDRLKAYTPVLLSADGQPVDAAFRKVVKDDVVVLVPPAPKAQALPPPPPPPPPPPEKK